MKSLTENLCLHTHMPMCTHTQTHTRTHTYCAHRSISLLLVVHCRRPRRMLFLRHVGDLVRIRGPLTGGRVWQEGLDTMAGCGQRTEPELAISSLMLAYVLGCVENLLS